MPHEMASLISASGVLLRQILNSVIEHAKMKGEFLCDTTSPIAYKNSADKYMWQDLYSEKFQISQDLFQNWVQQNTSPSSWKNAAPGIPMQLYHENDYAHLSSLQDNRWSVFYSLTLPGISRDQNRAVIQLTAYCPAGPPNYAGIFLLRRSEDEWKVESTFGLYNQ